MSSGAVKRSYDDNQEGETNKHYKVDSRTRIKVLVPVYTAGAIIGSRGSEISKLKTETQTQVHLSEAQEFFPGTRERIVVVTGEENNVNMVFERIARTLRTEEIPSKEQEKGENTEKRRSTMKCLVPASIAGKIVGKKGETVMKLQQDHTVKIDVMPSAKAIAGLDERCVDLTGELDRVLSAGKAVIRMISEEPDKRLNSNLVYSSYCGGEGGQPQAGDFRQSSYYDYQGSRPGYTGWNNAGYGGYNDYYGGYGGYGGGYRQGGYGGYPERGNYHSGYNYGSSSGRGRSSSYGPGASRGRS